MLKKMSLSNFTVFTDVKFRFSPQLNVIHGVNGVGKTHVLKAAYSAIDVLARSAGRGAVLRKASFQVALAQKLRAVMKPESLGRLARRRRGVQRAEMSWAFEPSTLDTALSFTTKSNDSVNVSKMPKARADKLPVYLPARELLSIYPGFVSLYETSHTEFDETWRDACLLLGAPLAKGPRETTIAALLEPLEQEMGGKVVLRNDRFYLVTKDGELEMHLVAEGLRKLATIARLIATGSLLDKGYLFWDEPEANLNPVLIEGVARAILQIAGAGVQVFVATHSLFLLRELEILMRGDFEGTSARFFGLQRSKDGVVVHQGSSIDDTGDLASLDAELRQSERFLEVDA